MSFILAKGDDIQKIALKLHRQFGHTSAEKLIKLLKDADIKDSKLEQAIVKVTEDCTACTKFKRPKAKPIVSVPLSQI